MGIAGKWKITEAALGGERLEVSTFEHLVLDIDQSSYQLIDGEVIDSGIVEMIEGTQPLAFTILGIFGPNKGKIFKCIYRFDGEDLITCYNLGGEDFPVSFDSKTHPLHYLVRYHRIG